MLNQTTDTSQIKTHTLIIGAGPFGLSLAGYCQDAGIDYTIVGKPMELWREHMPQGMHLRSAHDWHLDPNNQATFEAYLLEKQLEAKTTLPLSRDFYLSYVDWFQQQKQIKPIPQYVTHLEKNGGVFTAQLENGTIVECKNVVIALGFQYFAYTPQALSDMIPATCSSHTCHLVDFSKLKGKRCLLIGGRQSAFEWAALMKDAGVADIHLSHRHDNPPPMEADWAWVPDVVGKMVEDETWYAKLSQEEKQDYNQKLWREGRLKVEPWLAPHLAHPSIRTWPNTEVTQCQQQADGSLNIHLSNGHILEIDHVIYATGYKPNLFNIPFLRHSSLLQSLKLINNQPVLDSRFQTSVDGLYITSLAATMQFGSFFGFTVSVRTSAQLIGRALTATLAVASA